MVIWTRFLAFAFVLLLLAPFPLVHASQAGVPLEFTAPAVMGDTSDLQGARWTALLLDSNDELVVDLDIPAGSMYKKTSHSVVVVQADPIGQLRPNKDESSERQQLLEPVHVRLQFGGQQGSFAVYGATASTFDSAQGDITSLLGGDCVQDATGAGEVDTWTFLGTTHCPETSAVVVSYLPKGETSRHVTLTLTGAEKVRWMGATATCSASTFCPDGGRDQRHDVYVGPDHYAYTATRSFIEVSGGGLTGQADGNFMQAFAEGASLELAAKEWFRMPQSHTPFECNDCDSPDGRTVTINGAVTLTSLTPGSEPGTLSAHAYSPDGVAFFNEEQVFFSALRNPGVAAATAVAASAAVAIAIKLALPLFTRVSGEKALSHPRRERVMAYVQENPGATFRELMRETEIPAGSLRHHIDMMQRSQLIVERSHKSTLRYFENHGRYDQDWQVVVLLREPELARLHAWLVAHPESMQAGILDAMQAEGWSRSTTQNRLNRLLDEGLVTVKPMGRRKLYTAHQEIRSQDQTARLGPGAWRNNADLPRRSHAEGPVASEA